MDGIHPFGTTLNPVKHIAPDNHGALIVVCPHAGIFTPDTFNDSLAVDLDDVLARGDRYTDWISKSAPDQDAQFIFSTVAPAYLNVGRSITSIHPDDVRGGVKGLKCDKDDIYVNERQGQGLVAMKTLYGGFPIYKEGMEPDKAEIERRILKYYNPFHDAVESAVAKNLKKHGCSFLFDVHSCPDIGTIKDPDTGVERADIILGDRFGKSCDPHFVELIKNIGEDHGFTVALNAPYRGGYNTQQYGKSGPHGEKGAQSLQIEWNRKTMGIDQQTLEIVDKKKFDKVTKCHEEMIASLSMDLEVF